jgi:nanoRNase/pAp phosphatase (c-di-AMP/oligoRNAs hydrolase)
LDKNDFKKNDVSEKTPIIHVLGNVEELKVWTTLYYDSVGKFWKGSLRSRNIDLRKIAKKFDGGGHKFACGYKLSKVEDFNKVLNEIKKII